MVKITIAADHLFLEVIGTHKFWALKSQLKIPLEHVRSVHANPNPAMGWFQGLKIAGTDLPNIFRAGMFWQDGDKVFWDVRHAEKTIVIEMEDESCAKLIVEVKDPLEAVQQIRQAISDFAASKAIAQTELDLFLQGAAAYPEASIQETEENVKTDA